MLYTFKLECYNYTKHVINYNTWSINSLRSPRSIELALYIIKFIIFIYICLNETNYRKGAKVFIIGN